MAEVIWTASALDDVDAIAAYIAQDSKDYAALTVLRIIESAERLERFPESGALIQGVGSGVYRQIVVGNYRVIYRNDLDGVKIARVYHGARRLSSDDLER